MATLPDPLTTKLLDQIVQEVTSNFNSYYKQIYRNAAPGYGVGKLDKSVLQILRMPRLETTLPEVPNKMDVSPVISPPDVQPITATARDFRAKIFYLDDDQKDNPKFYAFHAKGFAESIERTIEIMAHEPFNRSTDATYTSGWDGLTLLSSTHKLENGQTYDNTITGSPPPSEALWQTVLDYGMTIPSAFGWPVRETSVVVVTGLSYARRWRQILGANTAIESPSTAGGANANPNVPSLFATEDMQHFVVGTPHLVDQTKQFFLFSNHELAFKERWREIYTYQSDDPKAVAHVAKLRLVPYWGDARRILGTV